MAERRASLMDPRIEQLMGKVDSKFTLVTLSSMRAREINDYYNQLGEGLGRIVPPQVTSVSAEAALDRDGRDRGLQDHVRAHRSRSRRRRRPATSWSRSLPTTPRATHRPERARSPYGDQSSGGARRRRRHRGVQGGRRLPPARRRRRVRHAGAHRRTRCGSWARSRSRRWRRNRPARRCSAAPEPIPHTHLGQHADLVIVAPATAKLLGKYAAGISDDLLTATLLATRAPVLVCPAMHTEMWEHAGGADNLATLRPPRCARASTPSRGASRAATSVRAGSPIPARIVARALEVARRGRPAPAPSCRAGGCS